MVLLYIISFLFQPEIVASGSWVEKSYEIEGNWKIEKSNSEYRIVLDDDFATKKAPDLKLFLSKAALSQLNSKNAIDDAVLIAELERNKGGQVYKVSSEFDLSPYKTIIIHCEKYGVLWGGAPLNQ
ncbi:MAG: DM13 domain-containing protein [Bacteroidota bacterium]